MRRIVIRLLGALGAVLLGLVLVGCPTPGQGGGSQAPAGTYSADELIAGLDQLQGFQSRNLAANGRTAFVLPGGAAMSLQDLSAYLNGIRTDFAGYVSASTGGHSYLVQPVKLSWNGESGLMWVPFTWFKSQKFPVISYQHGTQVFRPMAPSKFNANPLAVFSSPDPTGALQNYVECVVAALMASAGYIVLMPDYVGFGDSQAVHPYVTLTLGNSVAGIVNAAQGVLSRGLVRPNGKLFLTGYSEGGYATMAGARALQGRVTATIPCDGSYDLSGTMLPQMTSAVAVKVPWYLLYAASGYRAAYGADLAGIFKPTYENDLGLFNGNSTNPVIAAAVPASVTPLSMFATDPNVPAALQKNGWLYAMLEANNGWKGWTPLSPLVLVHCIDDDVVPVANAYAVISAYGFSPLVSFVPVPAVPFVDTLLGSKHVAAYPTAMLAAFTAIQTVNLLP
jgi:pimeloyl-ACP methyl ester carboxylesterase